MTSSSQPPSLRTQDDNLGQVDGTQQQALEVFKAAGEGGSSTGEAPSTDYEVVELLLTQDPAAALSELIRSARQS